MNTNKSITESDFDNKKIIKVMRVVIHCLKNLDQSL